MTHAKRGENMKRELCEQLMLECEQAGQKMGVDFYEFMRKAPAVVDRWKPYYHPAREVWQTASNREGAIQFLLTVPDPDPGTFEKVAAFLKNLPYFLRGSFQDAAKNLPPPPGGRPHELTLDECKEVCKQIGQLYGDGLTLAEAKKRMTLRYGVSLSTIQRAWQKRALLSSGSNL
jgi:hypothetical protein